MEGENSATIHQDAFVHRIRLKPGQEVSHELAEGRGLWLQIMRGNVTLNGVTLGAGDGASSETAGRFVMRSDEGAEALLFDLK